MGQDVAFLLLWLAIAVKLARCGRGFAAGLVLSLCVAKFHLFLLVPLALLRWREWRVAKGALAGVGILAAVSFAVSGWDWPMLYFRAVSAPVMDPTPWMMPNLAGLASRIAYSATLEILLTVIVLVMAWQVLCKSRTEIGLAAVLIGSFLVSHHAYPADALIILPACLTAALKSKRPATMIGAAIPLMPVLYQLPLQLASAAVAVDLCAVLALLVHEAAMPLTHEHGVTAAR